MGFVQAAEQQISFFPSRGYLKGRGNLLIQPTCVLWVWRWRMTPVLGVPRGRCCGIMGCRGRSCEPFGPLCTRSESCVRVLGFESSRFSVWVCPREEPWGGALGAGLGHTGEITSSSWPGFTSGSPRRSCSWRKSLGRGMPSTVFAA